MSLRCLLPTHAPFLAAPKRLSIVQVAEDLSPETFAEAVRSGLTAAPKTLPCRFFYDERGSELFEAICELPEYYLTRTEDGILRDHADAMAAGWRKAPALIELGSGSSTKTRRLLAASFEAYGDIHYLPIDVSPTILDTSARQLVRDFLRLRVTGFAGDYRVALGEISRQIRGPKLILFLGSSLGNYGDEDALALLRHIAKAMGPEDRFLLGTDLAKDRAILEAAYDDAQGVTAAFNRNLLSRINRELGADFDPQTFAHEARYRADLGRVEMHLVSCLEQTVRVPGSGIDVRFAAGESIHTENSHKYTIESLSSLASRAGFVEEAAWTDSKVWFRVQKWRIK